MYLYICIYLYTVEYLKYIGKKIKYVNTYILFNVANNLFDGKKTRPK